VTASSMVQGRNPQFRRVTDQPADALISPGGGEAVVLRALSRVTYATEIQRKPASSIKESAS
jgi:hypothetical protein